MKALDKLRQAKELLASSGIDGAHREAELILSHCLGVDKVALYKDDPQITDAVNSRIDELLERRKKREPLQYILGYTEFCGLKIKVGRGVLIPRPETELLVEEVIKRITYNELRITNYRILDLCTGSGCIALALAKEFPKAEVYGTDTSELAIGYAEENAVLNNINNVVFLRGNLFQAIHGNLPDRVFDLIVSNPPYIKSGDIKNLQLEIREWEPAGALDGGEDGLNYYRMIIPEAYNYLKEHGRLILEIGISQGGETQGLAADAGFRAISLVRDYSGIERILIAEKE